MRQQELKQTYFQVEVKSVTKNMYLVTEPCTVEHENLKKNVNNIVKFFQELEINERIQVPTSYCSAHRVGGY